ncbi:ClpXP protease specificity-enhancing factor [Oceanimonas sp. NS1]|nr:MULTISPECIES: ClpXP protease specificity-enhancing factor [Oceanimonas]MCT7654904.1 ClpXP protease specificity-enhancing factor [Oceanimonas sp. NS1]
MTPSRPYVLRAFYDWLLDNELTPHLLVNAEVPHTEVPRQYVNDGQIVLNISPSAVVGLHMDNEAVSFNARFGGQPLQVYIPMAAVVAIQARENGAGTFFPPEPAYEAWLEAASDEVPEPEAATPPEMDGTQPPRKGRPNLKVIK